MSQCPPHPPPPFFFQFHRQTRSGHNNKRMDITNNEANSARIFMIDAAPSFLFQDDLLFISNPCYLLLLYP